MGKLRLATIVVGAALLAASYAYFVRNGPEALAETARDLGGVRLVNEAPLPSGAAIPGSASAVSVQAWIPGTSCDKPKLLGSVEFGVGGPVLAWRTDGIGVVLGLEGGQGKTEVREPCPTDWRHFIVVLAPHKLAVFIDGVPVDEIKRDGNIPLSLANLSLEGSLDLTLFSRALGVDDVSRLARAAPVFPVMGYVLAGVGGGLLLAAVLPVLAAPMGLVVLGILAAFVLAEVMTRAATALNLLDDQFAALVSPDHRENTWIHRSTQYIYVGPSEDAFNAGGRYFRNRPEQRDLRTPMGWVTHDQHGFRALSAETKWPEKRAPEGPVRVAIMGDSMTWGPHVENDEVFSAVAQRWLDRWAPGRFFVVNTGVPGFSFQHMYDYYKFDVGPLGFDYVVLAAYSNDLDRAQSYIPPDGDFMLYPKSDILGSLGKKLDFSYFAQFVLFVYKKHFRNIVGYFVEEGAGSRADKIRSYRTLARLVRKVREDGARFDVLLTEPMHIPQHGNVDTQVVSLEKKQRKAVDALEKFFEGRGVHVDNGFEALWGMTPGQCSEGGRDLGGGHFSQVCHQAMGKRLAALIYRRTLGRTPPDGVAKEMPMERFAVMGGQNFVDEIRTETAGGVAFELVRLPSGSFRRGWDRSRREYGTDEEPVAVTIDRPFYAMRTEVTNELWRAYVTETGRSDLLDEHFQAGVNLGADDLPRPYVSIRDAKPFAEWLSGKTGLKFRVPSVTEWEWAARLGFDPSRPLNDVAVFEVDGRPLPVASRQADRVGLFDMLGNMAELTLDGETPVAKGGNYVNGPLSLRIANNWPITPPWNNIYWDRLSTIGLRLVADVE